MAKQLDPRMIGSDGPIRTDSVISNTLTASQGDIDNFISTNIITTNLTATDITTTDLVANDTVTTNLTSTNVTITNFNASGNITTNFLVDTVITANSYNFSDSDNSKVYHFDTTASPVITAFFLTENISNGFNVSIINTGVGAVNLSANVAFNAISNFNTVQHTGVLIYKYNGQFYGVGVFE